MTDRDDARYAAFRSKDSRFDGQFFVGVTSTGIYCRPVCRARLPRREHCRFFATAAEAEQAGFRPCLQCRPEQAPGTAPVDAAGALARRAAVLLEERCGEGERMDELAARLGCTDRHLRRTFAEAYHVSPLQYLQTCRLLLAKSLLTDTGLSVLEVAMAAGFGSLRRFNEVFRRQYRLAPTALRKQAGADRDRGGVIAVCLGYRPPYQWARMLEFLALRAIPGVEAADGDGYRRAVRLGGAAGWLRVQCLPVRNALRVTVSPSLLPVLPQALARVRHLFDLCCDPAAVAEGLRSMDELRPGLCVPGARLPGCFEPFEMAVRAVLGQQITVKAARTLAGRMAQALGTPVDAGVEGLTHVFPTAEEILALEGPIEGHLGPLGVIGARARTIRALAEVFADDAAWLGFGADPKSAVRRLRALPGIGDWTAQYIAMRALGWTDAFPDTDYGVKKALEPRTQKEIRALAEQWRPWRAYATINLWNSL